MMKKRVVSIMMTAAMLTGLLAGCGNSGSGNGTQAADADSGDRTEAVSYTHLTLPTNCT